MHRFIPNGVELDANGYIHPFGLTCAISPHPTSTRCQIPPTAVGGFVQVLPTNLASNQLRRAADEIEQESATPFAARQTVGRFCVGWI